MATALLGSLLYTALLIKFLLSFQLDHEREQISLFANEVALFHYLTVLIVDRLKG